jgi:hypothetical protein
MESTELNNSITLLYYNKLLCSVLQRSVFQLHSVDTAIQPTKQASSCVHASLP